MTFRTVTFTTVTHRAEHSRQNKICKASLQKLIYPFLTIFVYFFSMQSSKTPSERPPSVRPDDGDSSAAASTSGDKQGGGENGSQMLPFPGGSELNGRLRRLIAAYQRENKKEELRLAQMDKRIERRERIEQVINNTTFSTASGSQPGVRVPLGVRVKLTGGT